MNLVPSGLRNVFRQVSVAVRSGRPVLQSTLKEAKGPEFEQASLRVVLSALIFVYVMTYLAASATHPNVRFEARCVAGVFFFVAFMLLIGILRRPSDSRIRRVIGIIADNSIATYCLLRTGEGGAVILGVYLFVTLGNGFRYGRAYLHISQITAICGFSITLYFSQFWSGHLMIGLGFLITLLLVPLYTAVLTTRITHARQRADEANRAKGRFLANMSHEMRTPLNGVIAMADVLRETYLSESQREIVNTLSTSADLLLMQIEDVLDMAKIEAGRVQIEQKPFDLPSLLTNTVKVVLPPARYKGLSIITHIDPAMPTWFMGDPHHIRQVLLNLLSNAVKFTAEGSVTLRASAHSTALGDLSVRVEVQDTGIGIADDKQGSIFDAFTQADDSITRVYGGTGLGTTIARELVVLMGGTIGFSSSLGGGSTFFVELPLRPIAPSNELKEAASGHHLQLRDAVTRSTSGNEIRRIRGARVLVAEDNPTNQRVTQLILESGGHHPTIVSNGEAALDALEHSSFDLALFDLAMPLVSGLEALKLYKFMVAKPIPVLILSANVTPEIMSQCEEAGCAEFLRKPIRPTTLLDALDRHLDIAAEFSNAGFQGRRSDSKPALFVVDTPLLEETVLADLTTLSPDPMFMAKLLAGFRLDTERLVVSISEALAARKYSEVADAAHALKGGAGSMGATQLVQLAVRFEKASHEQLRLRTAQWIEDLIKVSDATLLALESFVNVRTAQSKS